MIRFYREPYGEYFAVSSVDTIMIGDAKVAGYMCENWGGPANIDNTDWTEIHAPDAYPIEERYLNATDNPYKDGFKYPAAGLEAL